jgi:hypothetical protein
MMSSNSQPQQQFNLYNSQFLDPASLQPNSSTWDHHLSQSATPVHVQDFPNQPSLQPWEIPKNVHHDFPQNYGSQSPEFSSGQPVQGSGSQSYTQYPSTAYSRPPSTTIAPRPSSVPAFKSTAGASVTQSNTPMALQPKPVADHYTYTIPHTQPSYQIDPALTNPSNFAVTEQQPAHMASGSFMASSSIMAPTTALPIEQIPKPPHGEKPSTNSHFSIVDVASLIEATNSKPFSQYLTITTKGLELPYSKGRQSNRIKDTRLTDIVAIVPKYDETRKSVRQLRQGHQIDAELKCKLGATLVWRLI